MSLAPSSSGTSATFASFRLSCSLLTGVVTIALIAMTGCGSGSSSTPKLTGNTAVTVVLSSTANDQVTQFGMQIQKLTLTSQSGNTVTLLSTQQPSEFMHLNGGIEPLTTATIPQDVYTSASVTLPAAEFVCLGLAPSGGLGVANYSIMGQGPTVNLASPITITGSSMALVLDMQVSDSAVFSTCNAIPAFAGFSLSPTFNLTPIVLSSSPTNSENGKVRGLKAEVASLGTTGSTLTLSVAEGNFGTRTLSATSDSSTVFQGVSGFSALAPGLFLDVDGAIQSDGSLLATRIAVEDPSAINQSSGPIMFVDTLVPALNFYARTEIGALLSEPGVSGGVYLEMPYFNFSSAVFRVSGQFTNLQNLPFVPSFTASNMVAGQNVDIASQAFSMSAPNYTTANTITLIPQTIDGTVQSISTSGSFTVYTVSLASYDLFPQLAVQPGQTTLLNNPSEVQVYVDSNTQTLNTQPLAAGSTLRFYGLVFNDSGTLRMDCGQVSDGVGFSTQATAADQSTAGQTQIIRRQEARISAPAITEFIRSR
jgi:hypothetical protein